jgi:hypothetical protein
LEDQRPTGPSIKSAASNVSVIILGVNRQPCPGCQGILLLFPSGNIYSFKVAYEPISSRSVTISLIGRAGALKLPSGNISGSYEIYS